MKKFRILALLAAITIFGNEFFVHNTLGSSSETAAITFKTVSLTNVITLPVNFIDTPTNKLAANGTIISKGIKVESAPWNDNVFLDNYSLPPLQETAEFIQQNDYLLEVAANGINLGEMNVLSIRKIEEL